MNMNNLLTFKITNVLRWLLLSSLLLLNACGGGEESETVGNYEIRVLSTNAGTLNGATGIRVSETLRLGVFDTETGLQDFGVYVDDSNQAFELNQYAWAVSSADFALFETTDGFENDLVARSPGQVTVTAVNTRNSLTISVVILPALLETVEVSPNNLSIYKGLSHQFSVVGNYSDDSTVTLTDGVTWQSSLPSVGTVDGNGQFFANGVGVTSISASMQDEFGVAIVHQVDVEVTPAAITGISIPANLDVPLGNSQSVSMEASYTDNTTQVITSNINWQTSIDQLVSFDLQAVVSANQEGELSIIASVDNGYGTTITSLPLAFVVSPRVMESVSVKQQGLAYSQALTIAINLEVGFEIDGIYSTDAIEDVSQLPNVTLTSSDATVAKVNRDNEGRFTLQTLAEGTIFVTASAVNRLNKTITSQVEVTVNTPPLVSLIVHATTPQIAKGLPAMFTASGTFEDGSVKDMTSSVNWLSHSANIANFDTSLTYQVSTKEIGSTLISASAVNNLGATINSDSISFTVLPPIVASVEVEYVSDTGLVSDRLVIPQGIEQQLQLSSVFTDASRGVIASPVWSVGVSDLAMITDNGNLVAGKVLNKTGDLIVSANVSIEGVDFSNTLNVNVTPAKLSSLSLELLGGGEQLWKGMTQTVSAVGTFSDDQVKDLSSDVTWSIASDSQSLIQIDGTFKNAFNLLNVGTAQITASYVDVFDGNAETQASISFDIASALLVSVEVKAENLSGITVDEIASGKNLRFIASGTYSDGTKQNLSNVVEWLSSPAGYLTIENDAATNNKGFSKANNQTDNNTNLLVKSKITAANGVEIETILPFFILAPSLESIVVKPINNYYCRDVEPVDVTYNSTTDIAETCHLIAAGAATSLVVYGTYSDDSVHEITESNFGIWSSNDDSIATVNVDSGEVTMLAGMEGQGVTVSVVEKLSGESHASSITLTRAAPVFETLALSPTTEADFPWLLDAGAQVEMSAVAVYSDGSELDVSDSAHWQVPSQYAATIEVDNDLYKGTVSSKLDSDDVAQVIVSLTNRLNRPVESIAYVTVGEPQLEFIEISPTRPTLIGGDTVVFTARGYKTNNEQVDLTGLVEWSSQRNNVATFADPFDGIAQALSDGTTYIAASYTPPGQTEIVSSTQMVVEPIALRSISITRDVERSVPTAQQHLTPHDTLADTSPSQRCDSAVEECSSLFLKGLEEQLIAVGHYSDGSTEDITNDVTWASSQSSLASVDDGYLVPNTIGDFVVTASKDIIELGEAKTIELVYTAKVGAPLLQIIDITPPSSYVLVRGDNQQYIATGIYSDGSSADISSLVAWTAGTPSEDPLTAVGIITEVGGIFSAQNLGNIQVSAQLNNFDHELMANNIVARVAELDSIVVERATSDTVYAGQQTSFSLYGMTTDAQRVEIVDDISWTVDNSANFSAPIPTGNSATLSTSVMGLTTATATVTFNGQNFDASASVDVQAPLLLSIDVSVDSSTVPSGFTRQLTAMGNYSDNSIADITTSVAWHSSNEDIVTVANDGVLTSLQQGISTISASLASVVSHTSSNVTVTAPSFNLLSIGDTLDIPNGRNITLVANATLSDNSVITGIDAEELTWSSSDESVATVDIYGNVVAISGGNATITVTKINAYKDASGVDVDVTATNTITVSSAVLASISIDLPSTMPLGRTQTFNVVGTDTSGMPITPNGISWSSSTSSVNVNNPSTGELNASTQGETTITVTSSDRDEHGQFIRVSKLLSIEHPVLESFDTNIASSMPIGVEKTITITGTGTDGSVIAPNSLIWQSSDSLVLEVTNSSLGVIKAKQLGIATITITSGDVDVNGNAITYTQVVNVTAAVLDSLSIEANNTFPSTLPHGRMQIFSVTGIDTNGDAIASGNLTWVSSSGSVIATGSSIEAENMGQATLTVTSDIKDRHGNDITLVRAVTVTEAVLASVSVDLPSALPLGRVESFSVSGVDTNGQPIAPNGLVWSSNSASITIADDSVGSLTAAAQGNATITVTSSDLDVNGDAITFSDSITVGAAELESFSVDLPDTIPLGRSLSGFTITPIDTNSGSSVTPSGVTWESNTGSISFANASSDALVADALGITTITVSAADLDVNGQPITFSKEVTVTAAVLESFTVNLPSALPLGRVQSFSVSGVDTNGQPIAPNGLVWSSNSASITIADDSVGSLTAAAQGNATVTVTSSDLDVNGDAITFSDSITVGAAELESFSVDLPDTIPLGRSLSGFTITPIDTNSGSSVTPSGVTWVSNTGSISFANASSDALVADALGITTITVSAADLDVNGQPITFSKEVTVTAAVLESFTVNLPSDMPLGRTQLFSVSGVDTNGQAIAPNGLEWISDSASITIADDSIGSLKAAALSSATITVTSADLDVDGAAITFSGSITVGAAELESFSVDLPDTIPLGRSLSGFTITPIDTNSGSSVTPSGVTWVSNTGSISFANASSDALVADALGTTTITVSTAELDLNGQPIIFSKEVTVTAAVLESFTVNLPSDMPLGRTQLFSVSGVDTNGQAIAPNGLEWISDSASITIADDSIGSLTAAALSSATITVTSADLDVDGAAITFSGSITVGAAELESFSVNLPDTIPLGRSLSSFTITPIDTNGGSTITPSGVTWTSSTGSVTFASASSDALVAAATGTTTITVSAAELDVNGQPITFSKEVTVTAAVLESFTVNLPSDMPLGRTQLFSVSGVDTNGQAIAPNGLEWISDSASITIADDSIGSLTAAALSSATITVTSADLDVDGAAITFSGSITVGAAELESFSVNLPDTIPLGRNLSGFTITPVDTNGGSSVAPTGVAWASSTGSVTFASASSDALVAAALGTTTITVSAAELDVNAQPITFSKLVTVDEAVLNTIAISAGDADAIMLVGDSEIFTAVGTNTDGNTASSISGLTWASSDESVASVDSNTGVVVALVAGSTEITATSSDLDINGVAITSSFSLTVIKLDSITVTSSFNAGIAAGLTDSLVATGTFSDASQSTNINGLTWATNDAAVAIVSDSGIVTGISAGTATITASSTDEDSMGTPISSTYLVTIIAAKVVDFELQVRESSIVIGSETLEVIPLDIYSDKSVVVSARALNWTSAEVGVSFSPASMPAIGSVFVASTMAARDTVLTISAEDDTDSDVRTIDLYFKESLAVSSIDSLPSQRVIDEHALTVYATAIYNDNTTRDITAVGTYSISPGTDASGATSTVTFGVLADDTTATETVTVTYPGGGATSDTVFTIEQADLNDGSSVNQLQQLEVYPRTATVALGSQTDFKVYGIFNYDNSGDEFIVVDVTASAALSGLDTSVEGNQTLTATYKMQTATAAVNVISTIESLTVETDFTTYNVNSDTKELHYDAKAYANFANGDKQDLSQQVLWQTSGVKTRVSNVDNNRGIVTFSNVTGTTNVEAQLFNHTGVTTVSKELTLVDTATRNVTALTISGTNSVANDSVIQLKATATYDTAPVSVDVTEQVVWSYAGSEGSVSSVTGMRGQFRANASVDESANVTATLAHPSVTSNTFPMTVTNELPTGLTTLSPMSTTLGLGLSVQFSVVLEYGTATDIDYTENVVWFSSDPSKVFISNAPETKGMATRLSAGDVTISAKYLGHTISSTTNGID